jgi:hypothetical protein
METKKERIRVDFDGFGWLGENRRKAHGLATWLHKTTEFFTLHHIIPKQHITNAKDTMAQHPVGRDLMYIANNAFDTIPICS